MKVQDVGFRVQDSGYMLGILGLGLGLGLGGKPMTLHCLSALHSTITFVSGFELGLERRLGFGLGFR